MKIDSARKSLHCHCCMWKCLDGPAFQQLVRGNLPIAERIKQWVQTMRDNKQMCDASLKDAEAKLDSIKESIEALKKESEPNGKENKKESNSPP